MTVLLAGTVRFAVEKLPAAREAMKEMMRLSIIRRWGSLNAGIGEKACAGWSMAGSPGFPIVLGTSSHVSSMSN